MEKQKIIISKDLRHSLTQAIDEVKHDLLCVLCDETTERLCLPVVSDYECMKDAGVIESRMERTATNGCNASLADGESGRWHGDRFGWFCGLHLQARHSVY